MKQKQIEYIIDDNGCWNCISHGKDNYGYPFSTLNKKQDRIYRHYYRLYNGNIPKGSVIRHTCDNKLCINPEHLVIGTHKDNVMDRVSRGRSAIGTMNGRSKLTNVDVLQILNDTNTSKMKLARRYGIDPKVIRDIKSGKTWKSVTGL